MNPSTWHTLSDAARLAGCSERTARGRVATLPSAVARHVRFGEFAGVGRKGGWIVADVAIDLLRVNVPRLDNGNRPSVLPPPVEVARIETPLGILAVGLLLGSPRVPVLPRSAAPEV